MYITHQCTRFVTNPKEESRKTLRWLGRYPNETKSKGAISKSNTKKGLEAYVHTDFSGNWDSNETQDIDTTRFRY